MSFLGSRNSVALGIAGIPALSVDGSATPDPNTNFLLEDGFDFLLEDGDFLLLES